MVCSCSMIIINFLLNELLILLWWSMQKVIRTYLCRYLTFTLRSFLPDVHSQKRFIYFLYLERTKISILLNQDFPLFFSLKYSQNSSSSSSSYLSSSTSFHSTVECKRTVCIRKVKWRDGERQQLRHTHVQSHSLAANSSHLTLFSFELQ